MVRFIRVDDNETLPIPVPAHDGDAGYDLRSSVGASLSPGVRLIVPIGFRVEIPAGCVGLVCPRSGLAIDLGVTVLNAPGVIDAGFTGEIKVILINHGALPVSIVRGDRIAQLVVVELAKIIDVMTGSRRGDRGFGSTGVA